MSFEAYIYNHSNDGKTAAIRFHQDTVRQLATVCIGSDENVHGRSLSDYITEADAATARPESFFRNVDILWQHPSIQLPSVLGTGRRLRVTYSGNVKTGGGISFEGHCVVASDWWPTLLPLAQTKIDVDYIPGTHHDLMIVR